MRRISFKRKQRHPSRFSLSGLFSNTAGGSDRGFGSPEPQTAFNGDASPPRQQTPTGLNGNTNVAKDGSQLDWYVEGPGRRVGYDDFTAIDWIYEYTKERQRKRLLYASGQGLLGHVRRLLEASNVWLVLVATGVAVGLIAAAIDIATDWLGDLKTGYCKSGHGGGKFYLNRSFCCWGHDGELIFPPSNQLTSFADELGAKISPSAWTGRHGERPWVPTPLQEDIQLNTSSTFFTRYGPCFLPHNGCC